VTIDDLKRKIDQANALGQEVGRAKPIDVCMTPFGLTMQSGQRPEAAAIVDGLSALSEIGVTWSSIALPCRDRQEYLDNVDWFAHEVIVVLPPEKR